MILSSQQSPYLWRGALWKIGACLFFAANNGIVKVLSKASVYGPALSPTQIAFLQNFLGFMLMLPFILPKGRENMRLTSPRLHFYRVTAAVVGVILWYKALAYLSMAEAVALSFTGPIFTVLGARLYLKEYISVYRYGGIFFGLFGAFLITRPDQALQGTGSFSSWAALFPLGSAIALAMAKVWGRELGMKGESAQNMTFYLLFFMAPLSLIPALFEWQSIALAQWGWILLLGVFSAGAHYSTSHAYKLAEVGFLSPFGLARLVFSGMIGFIFFQEKLSSLHLWIGITILMISSLCLSFEPRRSTLAKDTV